MPIPESVANYLRNVIASGDRIVLHYLILCSIWTFLFLFLHGFGQLLFVNDPQGLISGSMRSRLNMAGIREFHFILLDWVFLLVSIFALMLTSWLWFRYTAREIWDHLVRKVANSISSDDSMESSEGIEQEGRIDDASISWVPEKEKRNLILKVISFAFVMLIAFIGWLIINYYPKYAAPAIFVLYLLAQVYRVYSMQENAGPWQSKHMRIGHKDEMFIVKDEKEIIYIDAEDCGYCETNQTIYHEMDKLYTFDPRIYDHDIWAKVLGPLLKRTRPIGVGEYERKSLLVPTALILIGTVSSGLMVTMII